MHDYLFGLPRFVQQGASAFKPGLDRMRALLAAMDDPQERFPSIHVAGTNGKGSTASMVAAIGTAAGRRMGLHTSPHLFAVTERMRVGGVPAPADWLAAAIARWQPLFDEHQPSFFEATVALSFAYFAEQEVDAAVVEVGLGGRLDATNVLRPAAALITHIALDHMDLLGDTLVAIAHEKAGIIKPGVPVLSAVADAEASAEITRVAQEQDAPLFAVREQVALTARALEKDGVRLDMRTPAHQFTELHVGLPGAHQAWNAALAVRTAEVVWPATPARALTDGLRHVRALAGLRGRLDVLEETPLIVADVAHNPDGIGAALAFVQQHAAGQVTVVLGMQRDKAVADLAPLLRAARVWTVGLPAPRGRTAPALADQLRKHGIAATPQVSAAAALTRFRHEAVGTDALLLTGSHQVIEALGKRMFL